jgi:hypothetical protein
MEAWMRKYLAEGKPFADWQAKMHMRAKRLEIRTGVAQARVAYLKAQNEAAELRGRSRARLARAKVR